MESASDDDSLRSSKLLGHALLNDDGGGDPTPVPSEDNSGAKTNILSTWVGSDVDDHQKHANGHKIPSCGPSSPSVVIDVQNVESSFVTNVPVVDTVVAKPRCTSPVIVGKKPLRRTRSHPIKIAPVEVDSKKAKTLSNVFVIEPPDRTLQIKEHKRFSRDSSNANDDGEHCECNEHANGDAQLDKDKPKTFWFLRYSRKQRMTLLSLCLVDFTSFLGMSIMAPFFPMEASEKGMDEATVGFVFSAYALVMFLSSPLFGYILPHIGSKFLFLSGLFLAGGCTVLFGLLDELSGTTFHIFCFLIRSFEALGAAAYNTASCTMVADMFPDNVGAVFGVLETFVGLGAAIGPAIGGALYAVGGYKLPFLLLGAFMIVMVPINICLLPASDVSSTTIKSGSMKELLKLPPVLILALVVIVQASAWAFLDPYLEPHLEEFSLNTETVGLIFLMLAATYGIFCPIWGWIADRWDCIKCMMLAGMVITSFSLLLLGPSDILFPFLENELWLNIVSLNIMGMSMALALIPTFQSMMDCAFQAGFKDDVSTYSLVSGTWSAAYSFGDFTGPSIGGILVTSFGFPTAATGIAALIAMAAVILAVYEAVGSLRQPRSRLSISGTFKNLPSD